MPRYYFHTADGEHRVDDEGIELRDDNEARREAVRYGGDLLGHDPDMLLVDSGLRVLVTDELGKARFAVLISTIDIASIAGEA